METRKSSDERSSPLPADYLKLVTEIFSTTFDAGLKAFAKLTRSKVHFTIHGAIFPSEILFSVSLIQEGHLAATTVHASCDFDPKASAPTLEDILASCVDAAGTVFSEFLDPEKPKQLDQLADKSLSALEEAPFEWTEIKADRQRVFVKVDKSNPELDRAADEWLARNDPKRKERERKEHEETEKLFVTGPTGPKKPKPGNLH